VGEDRGGRGERLIVVENFFEELRARKDRPWL